MAGPGFAFGYAVAGPVRNRPASRGSLPGLRTERSSERNPVPLSRGPHHLQCTLSGRFNRDHERTGSLWQSRYQAKLIDRGRYLGRVVTHIHLNRVGAGLVRDPGSYVFGGHREIVKRVRDPLVDVDDCLLCFGETVRTARSAYRSLIDAGVAEAGHAPAARLPDLRDLVGLDRELQPTPGQTMGDMLGVTAALERPRLPAERYVELVCDLLEVEPSRLASRVRDRETAELRRVVATLGVERWSQQGTALAAVLNKNSDVVSWWVGEGVRRRLDDAEFASRLDDLDRKLAEVAGHERQIRIPEDEPPDGSRG